MLTDGSSGDNITESMELLQKSGIKMHVIGIDNPTTPSSGLQWKQLSGHNEDNLTILNKGFAELASELEEKLFGVLCSQPCRRYSEENTIPKEVLDKIQVRLKRMGLQ